MAVTLPARMPLAFAPVVSASCNFAALSRRQARCYLRRTRPRKVPVGPLLSNRAARVLAHTYRIAASLYLVHVQNIVALAAIHIGILAAAAAERNPAVVGRNIHAAASVANFRAFEELAVPVDHSWDALFPAADAHCRFYCFRRRLNLACHCPLAQASCFAP